MRIDPSMMKQLLQLQLLQTIDPDSGTESGLTNNTGTEFAELLEGLLGGTEQPQSGKIIPAAELLAKSRWSNAAISPYLKAGAAETGPAVSSDYEDIIRRSSARHGVDSGLVKAVIHAESGFNPRAVSGAGAKGLMQLMDETGQGLGVSNPFDPEQNIEGGTRFLSGLLKKYNGNEGVALAAYNAGPGRVDRLGIKTDADLREKLHLLPAETRNYVSKVLGLKERQTLG